MTTQDFIAAAHPKIGTLGAAFYFHPDTLAVGKELGLDGFRWYFLGRGGVLGDVEAQVVGSAFGYFSPAVADKIWTSARDKMAPRDAGRRYLECAQALGRSTFADLEGMDAYCAAVEKINAAADPAGLALYAALDAEPLADDVGARAMQLTALLREFRGCMHLTALVASGISMEMAHLVKRPDDYGTFGWGDTPPPVTDADRALSQTAEDLTNRLVEPAFSVVDDDEQAALLAGLDAMETALAGG